MYIRIKLVLQTIKGTWIMNALPKTHIKDKPSQNT